MKSNQEKKRHTRTWKKITKGKSEKRIKEDRTKGTRQKEKGRQRKRRAGGGKKNDGGVTVTRRSRLLSRHSARLSRERVIRRLIADRYLAGRTGYRTRLLSSRSMNGSACNATWHAASLHREPPSFPSPSLSLFLLSFSLSFSRYRSRIYPRVLLSCNIVRSRSINKNCGIKSTTCLKPSTKTLCRVILQKPRCSLRIFGRIVWRLSTIDIDLYMKKVI